ncbi:MAG: hypothetical protein V1898_02140 [Patescibacteria group bacterium]
MNNITKFFKKQYIAIIFMAMPFTVLAGGLQNPIKADNPVEIIALILKAMLGVLGGVTLIMFIYGGFMLIFSGGGEEKLKKGRDTLLWAIIGMAVVLSSYSILSYFFKILTTSI